MQEFSSSFNSRAPPARLRSDSSTSGSFETFLLDDSVEPIRKALANCSTLMENIYKINMMYIRIW